MSTATLIQATISFHLDHCSDRLMPSLLLIMSYPYLLHNGTEVVFLKLNSNSATFLRLLQWLSTIFHTKSEVLILVHQDLLQVALATSPNRPSCHFANALSLLTAWDILHLLFSLPGTDLSLLNFIQVSCSYSSSLEKFPPPLCKNEPCLS